MKNKLIGILIVFTMVTFTVSQAAEIMVDMYQVTPEGASKKIGVIKAEQTTYGTIFTPDLSGLPPGLHGFHVHAMNDCGPMTGKDGHMMAGMAAGGHYDPGNTNFHAGPYGSGHLGDLPVLYVDPAGMAVNPVLAPRLKLTDLPGRSLMIHEGGDNYSDNPKPLGGGGARIACGVIK